MHVTLTILYSLNSAFCHFTFITVILWCNHLTSRLGKQAVVVLTFLVFYIYICIALTFVVEHCSGKVSVFRQ